MSTAVSFDASLDCERFFLMYLLRRIVKKQVSLTFADPSIKFLSGCINNKSELGFVIPTGLSGEAVERISGWAQS